MRKVARVEEDIKDEWRICVSWTLCQYIRGQPIKHGVTHGVSSGPMIKTRMRSVRSSYARTRILSAARHISDLNRGPGQPRCD